MHINAHCSPAQVACLVGIHAATLLEASAAPSTPAIEHAQPSSSQRELPHVSRLIQQTASWSALRSVYLDYSDVLSHAQFEALLLKLHAASAPGAAGAGGGFAPPASAAQRAERAALLDAVAEWSAERFALLSPQALSLLVAAFGAAGYAPAGAWTASFLQHTQRRMLSFGFADLARVARGLAALGASPAAEWRDRFLSVLDRLLMNKAAAAAAAPHVYHSLLSAAVALRLAPSAALLERLSYQATLFRGRCAPQLLLAIVTALAALRAAPSAGLMEHLLAALKERWAAGGPADPRELLAAAKALAAMGYKPGDAWTGGLVAQALR